MLRLSTHALPHILLCFVFLSCSFIFAHCHIFHSFSSLSSEYELYIVLLVYEVFSSYLTGIYCFLYDIAIFIEYIMYEFSLSSSISLWITFCCQLVVLESHETTSNWMNTHKYEATIFKQIVVEQSKLKTEWDIIHIPHIFLHIILRQSNGNRFEWCRTNKMWISFALVSCNLWLCLLASKLVLLNSISKTRKCFCHRSI